MQMLIPFQLGLVVLGLIVVVVGAVISDPLLMILGGLMTAVAVTGLGMALRLRRRQEAAERHPAPGPR
ncbi:hypothetical protein [Kocuria palustris]|uniref:hypothetical protein n=1 Tax=Kocuria palustris TaxID=71999 RepID=UPI00119FCAB2|nr:hypothetical protein [Kocuria palustris]